MKKFFTGFVFSFISLVILMGKTYAQVAINNTGNDPDPSAMLDITSTNSGILIPRMTASDRDNIASPATGLMVYVTDDNKFYYYDGTQWVTMIGSPDADWQVSGSDMYSIPSGNVGIGTTNPLYKLDVSGRVRHSALIYNSTNSTNGFNWFKTRAASNTYGDIIAIQGGGTTIIGGGESAFVVMNNIANNGHETLYLASDVENTNKAVQFITNLQGGWGNRKEVITVLGNGNTGFGLDNPVSTIHVAYSNDAGPNGASTPGGDLTLGDINGIHLELDNNEIHAMNGSNAHNLYLNADGGRVVVGGNDHAILDVDNVLHLRPSTAPSNPSEGDIYYDQNAHVLKVYTNTGWKTIQMF